MPKILPDHVRQFIYNYSAAGHNPDQVRRVVSEGFHLSVCRTTIRRIYATGTAPTTIASSSTTKRLNQRKPYKISREQLERLEARLVARDYHSLRTLAAELGIKFSSMNYSIKHHLPLADDPNDGSRRTSSPSTAASAIRSAAAAPLSHHGAKAPVAKLSP